MRRVFLAAAWMAAGFLGAQSAVASTRCVNCNDAQMYNAARAVGPVASPFLVWDPTDGDVKMFRNYCGSLNVVDPGAAGKGATGTAERGTLRLHH